MKKRKYRKKHNINFIIMSIFSVTFLFIGLAYANTTNMLNITGTARVGSVTTTKSLTLSHTSLILITKEAKTIIAYTTGTTEPVEWSSSNPEYATVDGSGKITAIEKGETIITATCGDLTATCTVTVSNGHDGPIVYRIEDDQTVGNHIYHSIWYISNNSGKKIKSWSFEGIFPEGTVYNSSTFEQLGVEIDGNIFTGGELDVDEELKVIGSMDSPNGYNLEDYLPAQIKNIYIVFEDGTIYDSSSGATEMPDNPDNPDEPDVPTPNIPATGLTIDKYHIELTQGQTDTITATVQPENATGEYVWESLNTDIVTVENGVVTAISPGQTSVKVTFGEQSAQCSINVVQGSQQTTTVTLNQTQLDLNVDDTYTLVATVNPANTQGTVNWTSSNTNVAKVENGVITALSTGQTTITASIGNASATCIVNVSEGEVTLNSISLNKTELNINVGDNATLVATKNPTNAPGDIVWESNDSNIVSVDQNGNLEAKAVGTATITASVGDIKAQCTVNVTEKTTSEVDISAKITAHSISNDGLTVYSGYITLTNNSNIDVSNLSITLDLPDGTKLNVWDTKGFTIDGTTLSGGSIGSGKPVQLGGQFILPSGYNWNDYVNKDITITINSYE